MSKVETETKNGFLYVYPEGYSKEDFKFRISGTQLIERWKKDLPEIQSFHLSAFREEASLSAMEALVQQTMQAKRLINFFSGRHIRINRFRPTRTADMQDCFYLLSEVEKIEKKHPEIFHAPIPEYNIEKDFPEHPLGKPNNEDPLFVAVKVRAALMGGLIEKIPGCGARDILKAWVTTKYPGISTRQTDHIISIVNDGHGVGGKTKFKKV